MAASEPSLAIEEVIVTAQKQLESVNAVPIAITAFDEKTLVNAGIDSVITVAQATPGLMISSYNKTTPAPYIRGIGTNNSHVADDPSVSIFIDEVYISRPGSFDAALFDLERIEILRGPQGTLWGKNVAGGAIVLITRQPQREFESRISATIGNYEFKDIAFYLNGPLTETVSGKLAIDRRKRDGYIDNVRVGGSVSDDDAASGRAAVRWSPTSAFDILWNIDTSRDRANATGRVTLEGTPPQASFLPQPPQLGDYDKTAAYMTGYTNRDVFGTSLNISYEAADTTYTSITAWRHNEYEFLDPIIPLSIEPYVPFGIPADFESFLRNEVAEESRQFSQELRMNRYETAMNLNWTLGLYYFTDSIDRNEWLAGQADASNDTTSKAVFGQLTKTLGRSELWNLTLGLRYTNEEKDFTQHTVGANASERWSNTSGKFSIDYTGFELGMIYLSYAEGFKSGAFNAFANTPEQATAPLKPELSAQWELGAKLHWLDHSLQTNIAIFHTDYDDIQVFEYGPNLTFFIVNAAAVTQGVELEVAYQAMADLEFGGSYAYLDAEYAKYPASAGDYSGNRLQRAPENSYTAFAEYTHKDNRGFAWLLRADLMHQDVVYFDASNNSNMRGNAYTLFNMRASLTLPGDQWQFSLWGRNLTGEEYVVFENDGAVAGLNGLRLAVPGAPRTYGMTIEYRL